MICHICGGKLENLVTSVPFKVNQDSIVVIKGIPVLQCQNCSEYSIEDEVMQNVDNILNRIDKTAELEVFSYACKEKLENFSIKLGQIKSEDER